MQVLHAPRNIRRRLQHRQVPKASASAGFEEHPLIERSSQRPAVTELEDQLHLFKFKQCGEQLLFQFQIP